MTRHPHPALSHWERVVREDRVRENLTGAQFTVPERVLRTSARSMTCHPSSSLRRAACGVACLLFLLGAASPAAVAGTLMFNGVNQYLAPPSGALALANRSFTVEFWALRSRTGGQFDCVLNSGTMSGANQSLHIGFRNTDVFTFAFTANDLDTPTTHTDPGWHHYACVYDDTDRSRRIYVNGELAAEDIATAPFQGNANLVIGARHGGPYFRGQLDEVRVWGLARSATDIQTDFQRPLDGDEDGLLAYYPFEEGFGRVTADASGHGHTATLYNAPVWNRVADALPIPVSLPWSVSPITSTSAQLNEWVTATSPGSLQWDWGLGSPALTFDGFDDAATVPHEADLNAFPLTVTAWIKTPPTTSPTGHLGVVNKYRSGSVNGWQLFLQDGRLQAWYMRANGNYLWNGATFQLDAGPIDDDQWHYVAFVVDETGGRLFVDGHLRTQFGWLGTPGPPTTNADLSFGSYFASRFRGQLDDITLWNIALEPDALSRLADAPPDPEHPMHEHLLGHWAFDEAEGVWAFDQSDHGRHALLSGNPARAPGARPLLSEQTEPRVIEPMHAALDLDGVDDFAEVPSGIWFDGDFTLEAWVFPRAFTSWARVLDFGRGQAADNVILAFSAGTTGRPALHIYRGGTVGALTSPVDLPLNRWTHLAATWSAHVATLYLNGVPVAQGPLHAPLTVERTRNFLGRSNWAGDTYANALLDEVRIWSTALDRDTVRDWMSRPITAGHPQADQLSAAWAFTETEGPIALDTSGHERHATLENGATGLPYTLSSLTLDGLAPGQVHHARAISATAEGIRANRTGQFTTLTPGGGTALEFNGVHHSVITPNLRSAFADETVTVECWFNAAGPGVLLTELGAAADPVWHDSQIELVNTAAIGYGEVRIRVWPASSPGLLVGTIAYGTWNHVVLRYSKAALELDGFLNGVRSPTVQRFDRAAPWESGHGLFYGIGRGDSTHLGSGAFFKGQIDEVRIWNIARTAADLATARNARLTGDESGLVVHYRMDEGAGRLLIDSSAAAHHALIPQSGPLHVPSGAPINLPLPTTDPASNVGLGAATFHGTVQGDGESPVTAWFEYATEWDQLPTENLVRFYRLGFSPYWMRDINFDARVPERVEPFNSINHPSIPGAMWPGGPVDQFAARFTGQVTVAEAGFYTFYLSSDDGSLLFVNGQLVVNNDGRHGTLERSGRVHLDPGSHPLEVQYFEQGGAGALVLSWSGPAFNKQVIPPEAFARWTPRYAHSTSPVSLPATPGLQTIESTLTDLPGGQASVFRLVTANATGTQTAAARTLSMPYPGPGNALQFNGVDDYLMLNPFPAFPTTEITVEFWMRAADPAKEGTPFSYAVPGKDNEFLIFDYRNFSVYIGNTQTGPTGVSAVDGQWHHLAVTWSSDTGTLRVYLDGELKFERLNFRTGYRLVNGGALVLGQEQDNVGGGFQIHQAFAGELDDVRIWNTARSTEEIAANMNRRLVGDESELVAWWGFDEETGSIALDGSGNGLHTALLPPAGGPVRVISRVEMFDPLVTTLPAVPVLAKRATLRGFLNPAGRDTHAYFEYGTALTDLTRVSPEEGAAAGSGIAPLARSVALSDLEPGTLYYFRLVAYRGDQQVPGRFQSFTTLVLGDGWPISTRVSSGQATHPRHITDAEGNTYLAGQFTGFATFNQPLQPTGGNPTNAFIARLSRGGDWLWSASIGVSLPGSCQIHALALDAHRQLVVAGHFSGTITFGQDFTLTTPDTEGDLFIARFDGTEWTTAEAIGGNGPDHAYALAIGPDGALYVAGQFSGNATFGQHTLSAVTDTPDLFVARHLDQTWRWALSAAGPGANSARAITVDPDGNVYVAGQFSHVASFGGVPLQSLGDTPDLFVARASSSGHWQFARRGGSHGTDTATALIRDPEGHLYLLAQFDGSPDYAGFELGHIPDANLLLLRLSADANVVWSLQAGPAQAESLAIDTAGNLYLTGDFAFRTRLGNDDLYSSGARDVFIAQLDRRTGHWNWTRQIGSIGTETRGSVGVDAAGSVVVSGTYQGNLQVGYVALSSPNERDIFLARLDAIPTYEHNRYVIGQPVRVPELAQDPDYPDGRALGFPSISLLEKEHADSQPDNSFVWDPAEKRLFPVRPVTAIIKWPLTTDPQQTEKSFSVVGRAQWPATPQLTIAGTPVELEPAVPGFRHRYVDRPFTTNPSAAVDAATKVFTASHTGYTVLQFLETGGENPDPARHPTRFEVVRTLHWNDPARFVDLQPAVIGTPLSHPAHNDPTGRNGFLFFPRAMVDAAGDERAYDRSSRSGPLIPVNQDTAAADDDLVVIWYRTNQVTGIAWPDTPVRYLARWPVEPEELVIASGLGSGRLEATRYRVPRVYHQPDPALPGCNPNEEHAALFGDTLHALRNDLNAVFGLSEPYTLLKYRDPISDQWRMKVYRVVTTNDTHPFHFTGQAGMELHLPRPLNFMTLCGSYNHWVAGPGYRDRQGRLYARAAGLAGQPTDIVARYWYPLQPGFHYFADVPAGTAVPWLDRRPGGNVGVPIDVHYTITWPPTVPTLQIGETLLNAKQGLPAIRRWAAAEVIFDEANPDLSNPLDSMVRLFDPLTERILQLPDTFTMPPEINTVPHGTVRVFTDLPYAIRCRLSYDPLQQQLEFRGLLDEDADYGGPDDPLLLINVMSPRERNRILELSPDPAFQQAIRNLYDLTRNPNRLDTDFDGQPDQALRIGLTYAFQTNVLTGAITTNIIHEPFTGQVKALTAAPGTGSGYVTVVENDDARLSGLPVTLHILRVSGGPYQGSLKVLKPDNVFDEKLTIRHGADFAGEPQRFEFEWFYQPDSGDVDPTRFPAIDHQGVVTNAYGWLRYEQLPAGINGANDITFGDGAQVDQLLTLGDNWVLCRYRGYTIDGQTNVWSDWVGAPGGDRAQLAEGWVKRVFFGLGPFEARTRDFHQSETATYVSMIRQAGPRYEGPIAFNPSADNLNQIGLIEAYETVFRRAQALSIHAGHNYAPANTALLLAASRLADFYVLLGNEAYADAADPTIGFRTDSSGYGTLAPAIFTFQNQLDSLLDEELALLRGRDNRLATVRAGPVYNRLFWNFTRDQGEVAYAQAYNLTDVNQDGRISAEDARILYPQGHGDAWGHYLTALKTYYRLLQDPNFEWLVLKESMLLAGTPITVDFEDEVKFARTAAAKARTGAEIVDLTYRRHYVDDPAGQFQGYQDTDPERAWGLAEWALRAGQGALFDWITANALLPEADPQPANPDRIDRHTVRDLGEIAAAYDTIQLQVDKADAGLNPLGLAKNVVPFDIDPTRIAAGETHFEQVYKRALKAMDNAVAVFDHANSLSQSLRALQDSETDFARNTQARERDYKNRLIEIFGYPYAGQIGPGAAYPAGYDGPDLYHHMYVDTVELAGRDHLEVKDVTAYYAPFDTASAARAFFFFPSDLPATTPPAAASDRLQVRYPVSTGDYAFVADPNWGRRRAPGELQLALSDMVQADTRLKRALVEYDNHISQIEAAADLLNAKLNLDRTKLGWMSGQLAEEIAVNAAINTMKAVQLNLRGAAKFTRDVFDATLEGLPKVVGLASDVTAPARSAIKVAARGSVIGMERVADNLEVAQSVAQHIKELGALTVRIKLEQAQQTYEMKQLVHEFEALLRREVQLRLEALNQQEILAQAAGRYQATLAGGLRLIEDRTQFRRQTAGDTQARRYQDMTFRIFRNDALQKYRAQFDLAARYVYLAAVAYDYETQLLGGHTGAGREFLTEIVRQRSLGQFVHGTPIAGRHGLADPLARLDQNFVVLKGQLGFNNPQTETGRFSLRRELFRIGADSDEAWRATLRRQVVANLWDLPEFRRHCRPFAPESAGPQPGLVIRFPSTVTFGLNYFGWPLGGGDSAYDPSLFATKIRSAGVWFAQYNGSGLSFTPRVYLVPAGADIMRSPSGRDLETRQWRVIDQKIPVPFPIGYTALNQPAWIPLHDSLSDSLAEIRRFSSFRAYHDSGFFNPAETISDTRLIGRSVWNTDWMLIIPGGTFLYDPDQGLETFINTVSDVKIFFQTYAYSGN